MAKKGAPFKYDKFDTTVSFRDHETEVYKMDLAASKKGLTRAEWLRQLARKAFKKVKI